MNRHDPNSILIAIPTRGRVHFMTMMWVVQQARMGLRPMVNVGQPVAHNRNRIASVLLENTDCTHVIFCDDDILPPEDAVSRLLLHKKDIVAAQCPMFLHTRAFVNIWPEGWPGTKEQPWPRPWLTGMQKCEKFGFGLVCIKRHVFEKMPFPWFNTEDRSDGTLMGEDVWFCTKAREAGFELWADCDIRCGHFKEDVDLAKLADRLSDNVANLEGAGVVTMDRWMGVE